MNESLQTFVSLLGGTLLPGGDPSARVRGVCSKPCNARPDVALISKRLYPLAILRRLVRQGVAVAAEPAVACRLGRGNVIAVSRPVQAHKRLVRQYRELLGVPVIAVTGTAGKTTTKDLISKILSRSRRVAASRASFNATPRYMIIRANRDTKVFIIEMGMRGFGQIAAQCRLAGPTVGVITNIGRGHVSHCGSFAGVVRAKSELVHGLTPDGTLIINADDPGCRLVKLDGFAGKVIRYGRAACADYRLVAAHPAQGGQIIEVAAEGTTHKFSLANHGTHQAYNALAAMAAARAVGASWEDIGHGLAGFAAGAGRLAPRRGFRGCVVLDDSFNANPLSVKAGLDTLRSVAAGRRTVAVLGNMEDQGRDWPAAHRDIGSAVAGLAIDRLVTIGAKARRIGQGAAAAGMPRAHIRHFASRDAAWRYLRASTGMDDILLIKGSHSTRMDLLARHLCCR